MKSVKQQQAKTLKNAQFITLFIGLILFIVSFTHGANLTMDNPVKENMVLVMLFSCIVSLFAIISICTNSNKF